MTRTISRVVIRGIPRLELEDLIVHLEGSAGQIIITIFILTKKKFLKMKILMS